MNIFSYLPSTQFSVIVVSLCAAGGLVFGAQYLTHQPQGYLVSTAPMPPTGDWKVVLDEIQSHSGISLPETPSIETVGNILSSAKTQNLTETVARSLFITLTDAKAQGLGDDIPTQEELVAHALALAATTTASAYSSTDLTLSGGSQAALRTFGNATMSVFAEHPAANANTVLLSVGYALDYNDASRLAPIATAQKDYTALARDLAGVPVPSTLAPLYLQLINDIAAMGAAAGDIRTIVGDPVRGLSGVQHFSALGSEVTRVLTAVGTALNKNGILFSKEEPGSAWAALLSSVQI